MRTEDLVDPRLVPEVDAVGDDPEGCHRPPLQEPPDQPASLGPEDRREQQEEGEHAVEGLAGQVEVGLEVDGQDRGADVRHAPEAGQRRGPRDPGEPPGPEPRRLAAPVVHPGADHGQAHAQGEQIEVGRQPDGGQPEVRRVVVLELEHGEPPDETDGHQDPEADEFEPERPGFAPARPAPSEERGVERDEEVEGHLDAQAPRRRDPLQVLGREVDLEEEVVRGVGLPAARADPHAGVEQRRGDEQHQPVGRHDAQQPP